MSNDFKKFFFFSGSGYFGQVFEGIISDDCSTIDETLKGKKVALKVLKKVENTIEFYKEAIASAKFKHENIVESYGICLKSNFIVMELMEGGQLLSYLKSRGNQLSVLDLLDMSLDVAKGCAYLEQMKYVHRDLAARNCLLTSIHPMHRKVNNSYFKTNSTLQFIDDKIV